MQGTTLMRRLPRVGRETMEVFILRLMKGKTGVNRDAHIELLQELCVLELLH